MKTCGWAKDFGLTGPHGRIADSDYADPEARAPENRSAPDPRHLGRANVVFCDGHIERLTLQELGYVVRADGSVATRRVRIVTLHYAPDVVRANQVIGTPAEVIARLRAYEALGVDQFGIWLDNTTSFEAKRRMLRLFIDEVVPAFTPALR